MRRAGVAVWLLPARRSLLVARAVRWLWPASILFSFDGWQCPLWVNTCRNHPSRFTAAFGGKADVKGRKADIAGKALKIDNLGATVSLRGQPLLRCPMTTGSLSPATYPTDAITIRCDRCSRVGRYKRRTLIERYGHAAAMPGAPRTPSPSAWADTPPTPSQSAATAAPAWGGIRVYQSSRSAVHSRRTAPARGNSTQLTDLLDHMALAQRLRCSWCGCGFAPRSQWR